MLDSRVTGEVLAEARRAGAKVILSGRAGGWTCCK